jgi:hypothetical protein
MRGKEGGVEKPRSTHPGWTLLNWLRWKIHLKEAAQTLRASEPQPRQRAARWLFYMSMAVLVTSLGLPLIFKYFPDYIPGYVVQIPAIIVGFAYAWHFKLLEHYRQWHLRGMLLLAFIVPLENTFFLKAFRKQFLDAYLGLELFRPTILLLLALTIWTAFVARKRVLLHPLIAASFVLGLTGWAIATIASEYPALSLANGFFEFFMVLYLFAANTSDRDFIIHCLRLFLIGFVLVALAQASAMVHELCCSNALALPIFGDEFLEIKKNTPLMVKAGGNGYGNTDNLISLWTLALPTTVGLYYVDRYRAVWAAGAIALLYAGLLTYSRSGLLVIMIGFAAIVVYRLRTFRELSALPVALLVGLLAIHTPPSSVQYLSNGIKSFSAATIEYFSKSIATFSDSRHGSWTGLAWDAPKIGTEKQNYDNSTVNRMEAWIRGAGIGLDNWATGIGYGAYQVIDRDLTAPHSLLLLRFAEGGILSAIALLLLAAYPIWRGLSMFRHRSRDMLAATCAIAASCFMLKALIFGASFSIVGIITWGFAVALTLRCTTVDSSTTDGGVIDVKVSNHV